jgi:hypothetical protein
MKHSVTTILLSVNGNICTEGDNTGSKSLYGPCFTLISGCHIVVLPSKSHKVRYIETWRKMFFCHYQTYCLPQDDTSLKSDGGIILTVKNRRTRRKTTSYTTNTTWIDPGANPSLRGERPATDDLNHGPARHNIIDSRKCGLVWRRKVGQNEYILPYACTVWSFKNWSYQCHI